MLASAPDSFLRRLQPFSIISAVDPPQKFNNYLTLIIFFGGKQAALTKLRLLKENVRNTSVLTQIYTVDVWNKINPTTARVEKENECGVILEDFDFRDA